MQLSVFLQTSTVDELVGAAAQARDAGFESLWLPQIFGYDALTAHAVVSREVPGIGLGTAVVPTYPRHPMALATQATTVQQISGGRLTLGIGLSHQIVVEAMYGMSYARPIRHIEEYLDVLLPLLAGEPASAEGETITGKGAIDVPGGSPVPLLLAALGKQMLGVAGRRTQGTVTWMTGPRTLAKHIVPTITAAAAEAGRPAPQIVACLPTCVTDDESAARERAGSVFAMYDGLPSYRAMLDREGDAHPADVAVVGDAASVQSQIEELLAAGVTRFVAVPYAHRAATIEALAAMIG
jgi:F420-dependent oxidoreductase-like protein